MRTVRIHLAPEDGGGWVEFDSDAPLALFEDALAGDRDAVQRFLVAAVVAWSLALPVPAVDPSVLTSAVPWHWLHLLPAAYLFRHRLRPEEEGWILQSLASGSARGVVPELAKKRLCDGLHVPWAATYDQLPAGQVLRLQHALSVEAECREALGKH